MTSIEGTLLMLDDATPHVAVPVQVIQDGEVIATVLSDGSGRYQFTDLKPGECQVRCQILGGYVYYRMTGDALPVTRYESQTTESAMVEDTGDALNATHGKTLSNIDFHFAPFKKGTWKTYTYFDGLADNVVRSIYRDPDDVMWFGTLGSVSRHDGKRFVSLTTKDGLAHNWIGVILHDPDGVMWFGTWGGGVSRYDGKEFVNFTTKDGLAHNTVYVIHRDPDGVMWFGTLGGGLSRYDGKEFVNFTTEDGLVGSDVNVIYRDPDGVMWFGTKAGITRYRGDDLSPQVYIASVTTDRTYRDLSAIPAFTPGIRVTIEYSSTDLKTIPEKRQYRCRIEEIDSDWRKPTKETSLDLIFDEPGTYTFQVQAIDRDLNYSEPAFVKLEVIPDPRNHRIIQLEAHIREQELAEMERVQKELEDARQIQLSLLPERPPVVEGFEIAGISNPAREVSGDFYSYLTLGKNTGIVLADVTGKSVKAAMVATLTNGTLNAQIKSQRHLWDSPGRILRELNMGLQPHLIRGMFTAMSLGIIRAQDKKLLISNAGMPYPIIKRGNEAWELEVNGMPLGLMNGAEYTDLSVDLESGDFAIFCSDGIIEATNEAEEMYQTERLLEVIQQAAPGLSAQEMLDLVLRDVTAFMGDVEPSDDVTIIVLRCDSLD